MPKLLVFVPCEKVIISQDENTPTLVGILSQLNAEYRSKKDELPADAMMPFRWSIFVLWQQEKDDSLREYEQTIKINSPNGQTMMHTDSEFSLPKMTHRMISHLAAIPLTNGVWTLELYLREKGQPLPAAPLATYELEINFQRIEPT